MFIIVSLMTIPVAIVGVLIWPGTPARPNRLFLSQKELDLAVHRLKGVKADTKEQVQLNRLELVKRVFKDWKIYVLTFWDILFWNAGSTSSGGYLLWLKSLHRFSTPKVTQLGTTAPGLGIFFVLFVNFSSDLLWGPSGAIAFAHIWNLIAMVILVVWNVPEAAKWFAFNSSYTQVAMSSVLYGWSNDILRHNSAERSFTLVFMNLIAQSTSAWTSVLVFKTVEAPRFLKGWTFCACNSFVIIFFTYLMIRPLARKEERKYGAGAHGGKSSHTNESASDDGTGKKHGNVSVDPQHSVEFI
jgi:hypothetical protein